MRYQYNFITERHDYNDNGYIGLVDLKLSGMPEKLVVNSLELFRKVEFHLSIICARKIATLINPERAETIQAELVSDFVTYQAKYPMTAFKLKHEYYLMRMDERATLVGLMDMPSLEPYFEHLRKKYDCELPTQPAHITMYTSDPAGNRGIGILTQSELTQYGEPVIVPELSEVAVMI